MGEGCKAAGPTPGISISCAPRKRAPDAAARERACGSVLCVWMGGALGWTAGRVVPFVAEAAQVVTLWPIVALRFETLSWSWVCLSTF